MNVFDSMYREAISIVPSARLALLSLVDSVCQLFEIGPPENILTCTRVKRAGKSLLAIELVDVDSIISDKKPSWCAYAEWEGVIVSALQNLAFYGCRGDELAFVCGRSDDRRSCYWVLADPATMTPRIIEGKMFRSEDFVW